MLFNETDAMSVSFSCTWVASLYMLLSKHSKSQFLKDATIVDEEKLQQERYNFVILNYADNVNK